MKAPYNISPMHNLHDDFEVGLNYLSSRTNVSILGKNYIMYYHG